MSAELHLQLVDLGTDGAAAGQPHPTGWDAQLLLDLPSEQAADATLPSVFVGELSRSARSTGTDSTAPTVVRVADILGDTEHTIDEALIERIVLAFEVDGTPDCRVGSPVAVWQFLRTHEGRRVRLVRRPGGGDGDEPGHHPIGAPTVAAVQGDNPETGTRELALVGHAAVNSGAAADTSHDKEPFHSESAGTGAESAAAWSTRLPAVGTPAESAVAAPNPVSDAAESVDVVPGGSSVRGAESTPSVGASPSAGVARWGAAADWLTLATLRVVVIAIVALHLFVLVGEALIATP